MDLLGCFIEEMKLLSLFAILSCLAILLKNLIVLQKPHLLVVVARALPIFACAWIDFAWLFGLLSLCLWPISVCWFVKSCCIVVGWCVFSSCFICSWEPLPSSL